MTDYKLEKMRQFFFFFVYNVHNTLKYQNARETVIDNVGSSVKVVRMITNI